MKNKHHFAFVRDGKFSYPELKSFVSVYGLKHLNSLALTEDEQKTVEALNVAVKSLVIKNVFAPNMSNDAPSSELEKVPDWDDTGWNGEYYNSEKQCYTVVDLGSWYKTFDTDFYIEDVTSQSSSWGWEALQDLQTHSNALRKLSKKYNVSIEVKLIERIVKNTQALSSEEIVLRIPDNLSDFGRAEGFAVFLGKGYADFQWYPNTIEKAKLFGSEKLARDAMENNRCSDGVVVKVETVIKEICDSSVTADALQDALSLLQKERLENALQTAELETLRAHVARLENQMGTDNTSKRKM